MPLIALQSVDYGVGGPLLLERVDLAIEPGERIALIGRNGAGKSTLLKLLSGELRPDDGEVRVEGGRRVARLSREAVEYVYFGPYDAMSPAYGEVYQWLGEHGKVPGGAEGVALPRLAAAAAGHGHVADHGAEFMLQLLAIQPMQRLKLNEGDGVHAWTSSYAQRLSS